MPPSKGWCFFLQNFLCWGVSCLFDRLFLLVTKSPDESSFYVDFWNSTLQLPRMTHYPDFNSFMFLDSNIIKWCEWVHASCSLIFLKLPLLPWFESHISMSFIIKKNLRASHNLNRKNNANWKIWRAYCEFMTSELCFKL